MNELLLLLVVGVVVWLYAVSRARRLHRFRREVNSAMPGARTVTSTDVSEGAAVGTVSAATMAWHLATIDPNVIDAFDFASTADIDGPLAFANYVADTYSNATIDVQHGLFNRMLGYVGEQEVADQLSAAGAAVVQADVANQPVWDLVVNGATVNVKTWADPGELGSIAAEHRDVTYLVPKEMSTGGLPDNVVSLDGFSYDATVDKLQTALSDGMGISGVDALTDTIPVAAVALVAWREGRAVRAGKNWRLALGHSAFEVVVRGTVTAITGKLGAGVGGTTGPIGGIIGGAVGATVGWVAVAPLVQNVKTRRLRQLLEELATELEAHGAAHLELAGYEGPLARDLDELEARLARGAADLATRAAKAKSTLRWYFWPTPAHVLAVEAARTAQRAVAEHRADTASVRAVIRRAPEKLCAYGAVLVNAPRVVKARTSDADAARLARIAKLRDAIQEERRRLNPTWDQESASRGSTWLRERRRRRRVKKEWNTRSTRAPERTPVRNPRAFTEATTTTSQSTTDGVSTNGFAKAAAWMGALSFLCFTAVLAVAFGCIALSQISRSGGTQKGNGLAWFGIVAGSAGLLYIYIYMYNNF